MDAITPNLWFDDNAEEAAEFYVSVFPDSRITRVMRYTEAGPGPEGTAVTVEFVLRGQPFTGINGGPMFKFTEALSLFVDCKDQKEVDYFWGALGKGGTPGRCGWLKDRWGLSWQVVPRALGECLNGPDRAGAQRAMEAMLGMNKLDVKKLKDAYRGVSGKAAGAGKGRRPGR